MRVFEIPTTPGTPQIKTIALAGVTYTLILHWCEPPQYWVLDIQDSVGTPIVSGLPLITGADLLNQYPYLGVGGMLVVQTDHDVDAVPTFSSLGLTGHLYFIPTVASV